MFSTITNQFNQSLHIHQTTDLRNQLRWHSVHLIKEAASCYHIKRRRVLPDNTKMAGRSYGGATALTLTIVILCITIAASRVLTPPYFNLAHRKPIEATSTCGVGVWEPELFCKLTGADPTTEGEVPPQSEVIEGQLCDVCDPWEPGQAHPPEQALDGTERWWQSPPLSRGLEYNEVNLTIDLGQVRALEPSAQPSRHMTW